MRNIVVLVAFIITLAACGTTNTNGTPTPVGTFKACTTDAVRDTATSILGQVTSAMATTDWTGALATLAVKFGADEVTCAVQLVVDELKTKAEADKLASVELSRGQQYLQMKAAGQ